MLKSLKDARRRSVEAILEAAGQSEKTVDPEYDNLVGKFQDLVEDLNECGASMSSLLTLQKQFFGDSLIMAKCLNKIHEKNCNPDYWPNFENMLSLYDFVRDYLEVMRLIHEVYRSSSAMVCNELSLEPLRAAVTAMCPEVEAACASRNELLVDFDSYRRRHKNLLQKKEKSTELSAVKKEELDAEIKKFAQKEESTQKLYEVANERAKKDIVDARRAHDNVVEMQFITLITCQYMLFSRAGAHLEEIVKSLPQDKVQQVKNRVEQYISQEGPQLKTTERTGLGKAMEVVAGKAYLSEVIKGNEEEKKKEEIKKNIEIEKASTLARLEENVRETRSNDLPPPPSSSPQKKIVVAVYDHDAEDTDELGFKVGDLIEVIDASDSGWWTGKTKSGDVGIFPVNYVKVQE